MINKGFIITIEGTDGSGKQTQTKKLLEYLQAKGENVISQSFPNYQSPSSGPVKMYLGGELVEHAGEFSAYQSSVLFAADRLCTYYNKIKPYYEKGYTIIFDRYVESNLLHQASKLASLAERKSFVEWLVNLEYKTLCLPQPNMVIFLNMPVEKSLELAHARVELKNGESKDIHEADISHLTNAYKVGMEMAQTLGWNIVDCVHANGTIKTIEEIHEEIKTLVNSVQKGE